MNRTTRIVLSVCLLGAIGLLSHTCSTRTARQEALRTRIKQQSDGELVNGILSYCGQKIRMDWGRPMYSSERQISANGLQMAIRSIPSTDAAQVSLSISSVDPFRQSCFDDAVESQIDVLLSCNRTDAPIWTDLAKRDWAVRDEQPEYGVVRLQGDPGGRMNVAVYYVALPSLQYRAGEFPFQASCGSRNTPREIERCKVAYQKDRLAVGYSYLTRSIRPWREVDEVVRSVMEGVAPSTLRCPNSPPGAPARSSHMVRGPTAG